VAQADDAEEEHLDEPSPVPQQSSQESAQPEEARDEPEVAPAALEEPEDLLRSLMADMNSWQNQH